MGDSGTGKTHALRTLVDAGLTPFVIATEQNFLQVFGDLVPAKAHYVFIPPSPPNAWNNLIEMAGQVNRLSYENLTKISDPTRQAHSKFLDVLRTCNKFVCACCNKDWGDVNTWGPDRALCLDSLSGLSDMAMALVVGNRPVRSLPDWGVSMNMLKMFIQTLTAQVTAPFILIAHLDREKDEITGGTTITVRTLGQKLAPDIPRMFSDVIRARRDGDKYTWDTADMQATVVGRNLPTQSGQTPTFVNLFNKWKEKASG